MPPPITPTRAIPKILHQIWLSDPAEGDEGPVEERYARCMESVVRLHPGWQYRLWRDSSVRRESFELFEQIQRASTLAGKADLMRYEILYRHGGVYLDADMECVRPLDDVLRRPDVLRCGAFACNEDDNVEDYCSQAALGAVPGHPVFRTAVVRGRGLEGLEDQPPNRTTGPWFFRRCIDDRSAICLLPKSMFYPYNWDEEPPAELPEETVAIHRWMAGWKT